MRKLTNILPSFAFGIALALSWAMANCESVAELPGNFELVVQCAIIFLVGGIASTILSYKAFGALDASYEKRLKHIEGANTGHKENRSEKTSPFKAFLEKVNQLLVRHPFLFPFTVIGCIYLIHFVIAAPGYLSQEDTKDQLLAFFNLTNFRAQQVVLISPDVQLTNHHPVLHTLILGSFVNLGLAFGDANMGLCLYTLFQVLAFAAALSCTFPFLVRHRAPLWLRLVSLLFFALCPKLWNLSCLATKDVLFSAASLVFLIACADCLLGEKRRNIYVRLLLFGLLTCLLRNNGVFVVLATLPFFLFSNANRKGLLPTATAVVLYALVIALILPALQITGGSVRETLSVPLQQTARFLKDYPDEVPPEDLAAISRVADPDKMAGAYNQNLADYVKNLFRKEATNEDILAFLRIWISLGTKHPECYLAASIDNHFGFYCFTSSAYEPYQSPTWSQEKMVVANQEITERSKGAIECNFHMIAPQQVVDYGTKAYKRFASLPIVSQSMQAAFFLWLLIYLLAYSLGRRRHAATALCLALLTLYAISLLGPANAVGYTRYIAPAMISWPIVLMCAITKAGCIQRT